MLAEYTQARDSGTVTAPPVTTDDTGMSSMPLGIGIAVTDPYSVNGYIRRFGWNEENQLVWSNDGNNVVTYRYGADGERTLKYRSSSESIYFDSMWTCQTDGGSLRESKHIFVGQTRIATRLSIRGHADNSYPLVNTYYYHGDHLGSAQTVTDYRGALYERLEYTPYGELWVEQKTDTDPVAKIPYRFTGKEYDTETGLYAFGARYLNPVTGMWISADPALLEGSFLPVAPTSDEARKKNSNLPGMGGVFNGLNFSTYGFSLSNPVVFVDPTGSETYGSLNKAEKAFVVTNPFAAMKIEENANIASKMADNSFLPGAHNGKADAYRHALWSALNARDVGAKAAREYGEAHEETTGQPANEKEMDLANNDMGILIGSIDPKASNEELAETVMDILDAGGLKVLDEATGEVIDAPRKDESLLPPPAEVQ